MGNDRATAVLGPSLQTTKARLPNGLDVFCFSQPEAIFVYREVFDSLCYLKHGLSVKAGDVVMDVGANIGIFTLFLLKSELVERPGKIWAFEPMPPTVEVLRKNVGLYDDFHVVTVLPVAAGSSAGVVEFTFYPRMPGNSTFNPEEKEAFQRPFQKDIWFSGATKMPVPVVRLSDVIRENAISRVDFLKIDVEGAEMLSLRGIEAEHWAIVRQVALEVPNVGTRVRDVETFLTDRGFEVRSEVGSPSFNHMVYATKRS